MREPWSTKLLAVCATPSTLYHHRRCTEFGSVRIPGQELPPNNDGHDLLSSGGSREKGGKSPSNRHRPQMGGMSTRQHQQYPVPPQPPCQPLAIMASLELKGLGCHCDTVACRLVPFGDFLVWVLFSTAFYWRQIWATKFGNMWSQLPLMMLMTAMRAKKNCGKLGGARMLDPSSYNQLIHSQLINFNQQPTSTIHLICRIYQPHHLSYVSPSSCWLTIFIHFWRWCTISKRSTTRDEQGTAILIIWVLRFHFSVSQADRDFHLWQRCDLLARHVSAGFDKYYLKFR